MSRILSWQRTLHNYWQRPMDGFKILGILCIWTYLNECSMRCYNIYIFYFVCWPPSYNVCVVGLVFCCWRGSSIVLVWPRSVTKKTKAENQGPYFLSPTQPAASAGFLKWLLNLILRLLSYFNATESPFYQFVSSNFIAWHGVRKHLLNLNQVSPNQPSHLVLICRLTSCQM